MLKKGYSFLILGILGFLAFSLSDPGHSKEDARDLAAVSVQYLSANKKVIPLHFNEEEIWTTSIKLPDLIITNESKDFISLSGLSVAGMVQGDEVVRYQISVKEVEDYSRRINTLIQQLQESGKLEYLMLLLGKIHVPEKGFFSKPELSPSESLCLLLSRILYFHYTGKDKVDSLDIHFSFHTPSGEKTKIFPVKLMPYKNRGKYSFPLKGSLCIVQHPMCLTAHRSAMSQEFAIDIFDRRKLDSGEFSTFQSNPKKISDYFIFGREICAIDDGTVVETGEHFPESLMSNPRSYSIEKITQLREKLVPKIGFKNFAAGNYIVIDHHNGEYSLYAHLSEGSIRIQPGDNVKKGDIIAKVGNTGNSEEPHLHFHLMDSGNLLEANGLPIIFDDVPIINMSLLSTESNSIIYSEYLFIHISE